MAKGFKHGAGGLPLNFRVLGGTAAPAQPRENDIWITTDEPVTGFFFGNRLEGGVTEAAAFELGTIEGRIFTKVNAGKAAWAFVYADGFTGPMLVSPDSDACTFATSGNYTGTVSAGKSVVFHGKTYWYSYGLWMGGNHTGSVAPSMSASSHDAAALLLARTYESLAEGVVKISTAGSSDAEFNALKKNAVMVYPVKAQQYVSGAWEEKTAMSYQGGAWQNWTDWSLLFDHGDENTAVTGGYTKNREEIAITVGSDGSWTIAFNGSDSLQSTLYTANAIDLSEISTIYFQGYISGNAHHQVGVWASPPTDGAFVTAGLTQPSDDTIHAIDVSGLSGAYYFGLRGLGGSAVMRKVWME